MKIFKYIKKLLTKGTAALLTAAAAFVFAGITVYAEPEAELPEIKLYVIDQNGDGDFTTIQEGVDNASDGDMLVIYPGTYVEDVRVIDKELNIIGIDRDLCILKYDTASYLHMPLTIGAGKVANLTIYGTATEQTSDEDTSIEQTPDEDTSTEQTSDEDTSMEPPSGMLVLDWQKDYTGYAVHVDQNYSYGRSLNFENCRIISENNSCVGIGSRGNGSITFENCSLEALGDGGCIYLHDPTVKDVGGETSLLLKNCSITSYLCPYVMTFQSFMPEANLLKLTFQNTRVSVVAFAKNSSYSSFNMNSFFDAESLMTLENTETLSELGLTSSAPKLVHKLEPKETVQYMTDIRELKKSDGVLTASNDMLAEGITYLEEADENDAKEKTQEITYPKGSEENDAKKKHQTIAIYNSDDASGDGWCGLDGAYLTSDSFGNTLPEMNAPAGVINPYSVGAFVENPSSAH